MVGPSSLGVLNTAAGVSLNATFTGASVRAGALAICSPSGAVGIGLLGNAAARQLGISMFASLGNRADVSTNDLLECCGPTAGCPRGPAWAYRTSCSESCAAVLARAAERREWLSRPLGEPPALSQPRRAGGACGDLFIS
jgi:Succinyl-CoA ligase like flavodoxin domain